MRVAKVNGLRSPEHRSPICYVGRSWAGWPGTEWANHHRLGCPGEFRTSLMAMPEAELEGMLARLWEACEQGRKPLGCWCGTWEPGEPELPCHAYVWAELLNLKYGGGS